MEKNQTTVNSFKIDKKFSLPIYFITLIIAVILRTNELYINIDFISGKYLDNSLFKKYSLICIIIGLLITAAILIFGKSENKHSGNIITYNTMHLNYKKLNPIIPKAVSIPMIVMALLTAYEAFSKLEKTWTLNKELSTPEYPVSAFSGVTISSWFCYICMIVLAFAFTVIGINIYQGKGFTKTSTFLLTALPIWKLFNVFGMIQDNPIIGIYSEKVYILLSSIAAGVFIIETIRVFAGMERKNTKLFLCFFGYAASIMAAVSVLPRLIMYFTLDVSLREGMTAPDVSDFGMIFLSFIVVCIFWGNYNITRKIPALSKKGSARHKWVKVSRKSDKD